MRQLFGCIQIVKYNRLQRGSFPENLLQKPFFSIPTDTQRSFNFYKMSIQRRRSHRDVLQTSKRHRVSTGYTSGQSSCNISLQWNIHFVRTQHFLKQQHFLPPTLLRTRVYASGVRNVNFSKKFSENLRTYQMIDP